LILVTLVIFQGCNPELTNPGPSETTTSEGVARPENDREWESFNDFITSVYQAADSNKQALVDSFLIWADDLTGIPFIEENTAWFLYTSNSVSSVQVAGDFNGWNPNGSSLNHLTGTNLHYRGEDFEMDARLDYKFVLNGNNWILDPRNPCTCSGGYGPNSELSMPNYVQPPEIQTYDIPHGSLESFYFSDTTQGRTRSVKVYLPAGYEMGSETFRTAYFHDGGEYISLGYARNVLDYLIYHEEIPPIIGVFVNPTNRMEEYAYDYNFMSMFVNELVTHIDTTYRTSQLPEHRAVIGVSLGGLASLFFTIQHPEVFLKCGAYSPAIWGEYNDVVAMYENSPVLPAKIYIDGGTYEASFLDAAFELHLYLDANGWDTRAFVWHEGHSWGAWRAHLDESLKYFWPMTATGIDEG